MSPFSFRNLRKRFGTDDAYYLKSLTKFPLKLYLKACPCVYQTIWNLLESFILSLQVKEYCPLVFRNLRKRFGIDDACYLKSLTKAPQPMEPPTGRSGGAKFYTSQDHIYTIKACPCFQPSKIEPKLVSESNPYKRVHNSWPQHCTETNDTSYKNTKI